MQRKTTTPNTFILCIPPIRWMPSIVLMHWVSLFQVKNASRTLILARDEALSIHFINSSTEHSILVKLSAIDFLSTSRRDAKELAR